MNVLDDRDLTDDERRAVDDVERPGVWRHHNPNPPPMLGARPKRTPRPPAYRTGNGFDEHQLDQYETDMLIAYELWQRFGWCDSSVSDEITRIIGSPAMIAIEIGVGRWNGVGKPTSEYAMCYATEQRGGIHSDPLVRLLAYRTWGERDRMWGVARVACRSLPVATKTGGRRTWIDGPLAERILLVVDGIHLADGFAAIRDKLDAPTWPVQYCLLSSRRECGACHEPLHTYNGAPDRPDWRESNAHVTDGSVGNKVCEDCYDAVTRDAFRWDPGRRSCIGCDADMTPLTSYSIEGKQPYCEQCYERLAAASRQATTDGLR